MNTITEMFVEIKKVIFTDESIKGLKELGRMIMLAVVAYLLTDGVLGAIVGVRLDPEMKVVAIGLITSVLKATDKWLHEIGVATNNVSLIKGLTQF